MFILVSKFCEHQTKIDFMCNYLRFLVYVEWLLGPLKDANAKLYIGHDWC